MAEQVTRFMARDGSLHQTEAYADDWNEFQLFVAAYNAQTKASLTGLYGNANTLLAIWKHRKALLPLLRESPDPPTRNDTP